MVLFSHYRIQIKPIDIKYLNYHTLFIQDQTEWGTDSDQAAEALQIWWKCIPYTGRELPGAREQLVIPGGWTSHHLRLGSVEEDLGG